MERLKDFDSFYDQYVVPLLPELKSRERKAGDWGKFSVVSLVLFVLSLFANNADMLEPFNGWVPFLCLVAFIAGVYFYARRNDEYEDTYKKEIVALVIRYLHEGLNYVPEKCISSNEYKVSGLYRVRYHSYDGGDYIRGIYKNISFHCCELHVSGAGRRRSGQRRYTLFRGLFFSAAINAGYTGRTYVWLKGNSQLGGSIADERYRLFPIPKVYHVHPLDPEFDQQYTVYSSDPSEARTILSPSMVHAMVNLRKQLQKDIVFSFVGQRCFAAIPIDEQLLEPSEDPGNREEVREIFFTVLLPLVIINQLPLIDLQ